jgi:5-methylcytosine-specific restriction protein A
MARREFPRSVRVAVIKRCTRDNVIYCEACGLPAKRFQIDHIIADAHGGDPILENAQLLCEACYGVKNPKDTTIAAKLKRIEARHLGANRPKGKIASRGFPKRKERSSKPSLPPRQLYR